MSKIQLSVKDPDAIFEIINAHIPYEDTEACEAKREKFADKWFEFGDYMVIEIDIETMACKLVERKRWRV